MFILFVNEMSYSTILSGVVNDDRFFFININFIKKRRLKIIDHNFLFDKQTSKKMLVISAVIIIYIISL